MTVSQLGRPLRPARGLWECITLALRWKHARMSPTQQCDGTGSERHEIIRQRTLWRLRLVVGAVWDGERYEVEFHTCIPFHLLFQSPCQVSLT